MTFLNFSQLPESVFCPNFPENTFLKTKPNFSLTGKCFPLTGKCFPLTNFPEDKQKQESLESGFPESEFRETNIALESLVLIFHDAARKEYNLSHYYVNYSRLRQK